MRTILDLIKDRKCYQFYFYIEKGYHLFFDCLEEFGGACCCSKSEFDITYIDSVNVELINEETNEAIMLNDTFPITLKSNFKSLYWYAIGFVDGKYKSEEQL